MACQRQVISSTTRLLWYLQLVSTRKPDNYRRGKRRIDRLPSCVNSRSFSFKMEQNSSHLFWIMASSTSSGSTACYRFPAPSVLCILIFTKDLDLASKRTRRLGCPPRSSKVPPPISGRNLSRSSSIVSRGCRDKVLL